MVPTFPDKRVALAETTNTSVKYTPKMELGVCMGPDPVTGHAFFLLANGLIVPRKPGTPLPAMTPFDWKPKPYTIPDSAPPLTPPLPPHLPAPLATHNSVVQLPHVAAIPALRATTGLYVPSLDSAILHDIRSLHLPHPLTPPGLSPTISIPLPPLPPLPPLRHLHQPLLHAPLQPWLPL